MKKATMIVLALALALPAAAEGATYAVPSTTDDSAWMQSQGLTPVASVEVNDEAVDYKLPDRCWHARVFAGLRNAHGKFTVWAWNKGIICSLNGRIDEYHQRHGKGSAGIWEAGPYPTIAYQRRLDRTCCHVFSHYETSWRYGSGWQRPIWGVTLNLHQYFSKRVDRKVAWHHYPSS